MTIQNEYENLSKNKLKELLETASQKYYVEGTKIMSDENFDEIKEYYEEKFNEVYQVGSIPQKGVISVSHSFESLANTLGKVNNFEEFSEWYHSKVKSFMAVLKLLISLKYDGNSLIFEYTNRKPTKVLTRGKNNKGVDLTEHFQFVELPDHPLVNNSKVGVKYEAVISTLKFDDICEEIGLSYANPRSLVSGILQRDDAYKYTPYIDLVPLGVIIDGHKMNRLKELQLMEELFSNNDFNLKSKVLKSFAEVEGIYEDLSNQRNDFPSNYMCDGLVIEFLDENIRKELGFINRTPKYAIALKFPYMEKESVVIGCEFDYGNTGRFTPCILFEPVTFNGAVQKRVSIANYKRFKELNLGIGSKVLIQYRRLRFILETICLNSLNCWKPLRASLTTT